MGARCRWRLIVLCGVVLTACATPYHQARSALAKGHFAEAVTRFEAVLAREPDRVDALTGLGIARYKLGAYDAAAAALRRAVDLAPNHPSARLYLGLTALRTGDLRTAEEQLTAFRAIRSDPRITAPVDRALTLMRDGRLTDEVRQFIAAGLEDHVALIQALDQTKERLRDGRPLFPPVVHCVSAGPSRIVCF